MMEAERFERIPSQGIRTFINTKQVLIGNLSLLSTYHITLPETLQTSIQPYSEKGAIIIYLAIDNTFAGFIALSDTVRPKSLATIDALKSSNYQPVLLTGDSQPVAKTIANQLGIHEFHAACLPEDKLNHIDQYQTQHQPVCMIGDGINDAPALKKAFVGIAMGKIGSDIAVDAADIVLVNDKVEELPHLLKLSQRMMKTIKLNMASSMTLNFIAIILACIGILNPIGGALLHNAGSIAVILNSALLLRWSAKN